jgi:hypothetical protein
MRKLLTSFFLLYALFARTQNIQVLSAKDSLRVSFASLLISNESINYSGPLPGHHTVFRV